MIKYTCDRCDKEIDENYFTCRFGGVSDSNGMLSSAGASINIQENSRKERMLCYKCMMEIKHFADTKKEKPLSFCTGYATGRFTYIPGEREFNDYERRKTKEVTGRIAKRNNNSFFGRKR